jgi:uncharacterized protein YjdB
MVDMKAGQEVDLSVAFQDASGGTTPAPGPVTWTSSDDKIATVEADSGDDTKAVALAIADGTATITAASDNIDGTIDITVEAGEAVTATITAGTPHDANPPAAPANGS